MRGILALVILFCILNFFGCATCQEGAKGFLGISTKVLEEKRSQAEVIVVKSDYVICYEKTIARLKRGGSYFYLKNEDFVAFYLSPTDTTPVGIFFKKLGAKETQLEISSSSQSAKEKIVQRINAEFKQDLASLN